MICKWGMKWYLMRICASWLWTARPHYAGGIWQRKIYSKNASNVSVHTTPEDLKNATIFSDFGFVVGENYRDVAVFVKLRCQNGFRPRENENSFSYYILGFEERFLKAPFSWRINVGGRPNRTNKAAFSWRISVDGRLNRRNEASFSHFSGVVNATRSGL